MLLEELYTFFVSKPTLTSSTKRKYKKEDVPEILICPEPSIDIKALKSLGYSSKDFYYAGFGDLERGYLGWGGNESKSTEEVSKQISTIKSVEDCAIQNKSFLIYSSEENNDFIFKNLKFKLRNALYPHHICCELITPVPKDARFNQAMVFILEFSFENKSFGSFQIFLADKTSSSFYDMHKTKMLGDKLTSKPGMDGLTTYIVEIEEEQHLEDDPNYPCIDYQIEGEYHKCLENEHMSKMLHFLNCTPPWMTENKQIWCKPGLQFDMSQISEYLTFVLSDVGLSAADPGKCLTPCTSKRYFSKSLGLKEGEGKNGIEIVIERGVKIIKSEFQIGFKTLITRFGGIIGVSKNLLWIVIFMFSSFGFLFHKMSRKSNVDIQK